MWKIDAIIINGSSSIGTTCYRFNDSIAAIAIRLRCESQSANGQQLTSVNNIATAADTNKEALAINQNIQIVQIKVQLLLIRDETMHT